MGAGDLVGDVHVAAGGDPAGLDMAGGAAGEFDQELHLVVVADPAPFGGAGADRALLDHRRRLAGDRGDLADQQPGDADDVAAEIAERAGPPGDRRIAAPDEGMRRIRHVVLVMRTAEMHHLADGALVDQLLGEADQGIAQVAVADQALDPGPAGGGGDLAGLAAVQRHRLLAIDVLAGGDRRQRDLAMQVAGDADVDDVHRRIGDQSAPVGGVAAEAEALRRRPGEIRRQLGDDLEVRKGRRLGKHRDHRAIAVDMATGDEAAADEANAQPLRHPRPPPSASPSGRAGRDGRGPVRHRYRDAPPADPARPPGPASPCSRSWRGS